MPIEIFMPALSPTMKEGTLAKWLVAEGDYIAAGDIIAEIETDKATMEVESIDEGTVAKILVAQGSQGVKVNSVIAILAEENENVATLASSENAPSLSDETHSSSPPKISDSPNLTLEEKQTKSTDFPSNSHDEALVTEPFLEIPEGTKMITMSVREALRGAMAEEMHRDREVFIMGEEVAEYQGAYKVTQGLLEEFGEKRVIDTPITEHGFAGLGIGAAMAGLKPIIEFMTFNFSMQAMDQIVNSAAKTLYMSGGQMGAPIVLRGPNGAAAQVGAQHSQCYAAWYSHIPGLKVVMPYRACDAKGLLKSAIRDPNPVIFLENEILYGQTFEVPDLEDYLVPIGKARIARTGNDATIVSFGIGMNYALKAAEILTDQGIDVEIIDLRTIRPMDMDSVIASVMKTGRCVTVEEGFPQSCVGSHIASQIMQCAFDYLDAPVLTICGKDVPMPYAANLEKLTLPSVDEVVNAVKTVAYAR